MLYRRFGRTELQIPVLSSGGMRFQQSWKAADVVEPDNQANLEACVRRALEVGVHHIETARGYGTSEAQLGKILPTLPRDQLLVQTKVAPTADPAEFARNLDDSMQRLGVDYLDLFGVHGVNDEETLDWTVRDGGCLEHALHLQQQGRIRHIGFSTHGPTPIIVQAIEDGRFEYVNLHYYYLFQNNAPAVAAATARDMGVFIISPTNKGGKLNAPPPKLVELTQPLSPMEFNDLWLLTQPEIHTLSVGVARPSDFDAHVGAVERLAAGLDRDVVLGPIEERVQAELRRVLGAEWVERWQEGLPDWCDMPGQVNVREILRLYNLARGLDLIEYAKMRYNLFEGASHWFPGFKADKLADVPRVDALAALSGSPFPEQVARALSDAHELLVGQPIQRLMQDE